jgi:hypothetical protein
LLFRLGSEILFELNLALLFFFSKNDWWIISVRTKDSHSELDSLFSFLLQMRIYRSIEWSDDSPSFFCLLLGSFCINYFIDWASFGSRNSLSLGGNKTKN